MPAILAQPGEHYGRWTVVRSFTPPQGGASQADVKCACGATRVVSMNSLRTGRSRSCGCYMREQSRDHLRTITTTHGLSKDAAYECWKSMKARCFNRQNHKYPEYGGRGISVCEQWRRDFPAFLAHIGPRPSVAHQIDRINNDGDYAPGNVRWATAVEQANNRRRRRWGKKP